MEVNAMLTTGTRQGLKMIDGDLTIRYADADNLTAEDYEEMSAVSRAAFSEYKAAKNLNFRGVTMTADYVREQAKHGICFINLYLEKKLIAYCGTEIRTDSRGRNYMYCQGIAVHPEYRRMHLGRHLIGLRDRWGAEHGAEYFELNTSCKAIQAIRFHQSNQYKPWAYTHFSTTNYYSVIMRKSLTLHWSECERWRSLVFTWIYSHLSWNEAGNRRPFGMAVRRMGGCILRTLMGRRGC